MRRISRLPRSLLLACFALAFLALSCHLGQETQVQRTLSFTRHFDSLSLYDSIRIEVQDPEGNPLAVVFEGRLESPTQLDGLEVPGWDGEPIAIIISGFTDSQAGPVYREERRYDGKTRKTDTVLIHLHPHPTLLSESTGFALGVGQRIPLPRVQAQPPNLVMSGPHWSTDNPGVAVVEGGDLVGVAAGDTRLHVRVGQDGVLPLSFAVRAEADSRAPTHLNLVQDTLHLALRGATGRFGIEVDPPNASAEVD